MAVPAYKATAMPGSPIATAPYQTSANVMVCERCGWTERPSEARGWTSSKEGILCPYCTHVFCHPVPEKQHMFPKEGA